MRGSAVTRARVYYKGSNFAAFGVEQAIDTSKSLLQASANATTTTFANVTNYTRGLNGLVFDVAGMPAATLTSNDFIFRVAPTVVFGNVDPSQWLQAPSPSLITVTPGTTNAPASVLVEWNNNAIQNTWLQIIVKANANTGLTQPAVYYVETPLAKSPEDQLTESLVLI